MAVESNRIVPPEIDVFPALEILRAKIVEEPTVTVVGDVKAASLVLAPVALTQTVGSVTPSFQFVLVRSQVLLAEPVQVNETAEEICGSVAPMASRVARLKRERRGVFMDFLRGLIYFGRMA